MLKIHTYYLSNTEKELKYVGQNISDDELKNLASNSNIWLGDNSNDYVKGGRVKWRWRRKTAHQTI